MSIAVQTTDRERNNMRLFQGLTQAIANVIGSNDDDRPTRVMQESHVTLTPEKYTSTPGANKYIVFLSELTTFYYRPTIVEAIDINRDGTNIFAFNSLTKICEDEQGIDLYDTGLLTKLKCLGYDIWIVIDMTFVAMDWLRDQGISDDHIIDTDERDLNTSIIDAGQTTFDARHTVAKLYEAIGFGMYISRPYPPAKTMVNNLALYGLGVGPNPPQARVTIH